VTEVRDHLSEHIGRERLRLELTRAARPAVIVTLGALVALAVAAYIAVHASRTLLSSTQQVRFAVDDATGVVPGVDQVRVKGIPAGTITAVKMLDGQPVLTAVVQRKYGPIYRDARALLRPNTALMDMYLDIIDRGTRRAGPAGDGPPLPATQTDTSVNIDDVLGVFGATARNQLATMLDNLGNGLHDRGAALRESFIELVPFLAQAGEISQQLAQRAPLTRQLVHNTAVLTAELGRRERELRVLLTDGSTTLTALGSSTPQLNATLHQLPATLAALDSSFASVRGVLPDVDAAMRSLSPVAAALPTGLAALRRLAASATPAVNALQTPIARLVPLAQALTPLSASLNRAVVALGPQTGTIDRSTSDLAACTSGLQGFFQWDASLSKFGDARGPVPRGDAAIGAQSSGLLADPNEFAPQACTPGQTISGRLPASADEH
jgi:ABC-type transporter Mla subunit MlaD